ncbi:Hypothetical predicted protein [Pelobates cultripes]|uniref:UPAR/Ly6 domain-containing protein n=1 Tax=Pelobates cultripes TaxID=61616 RepID=A0AAD1SYF9_PELCU|nr:Hypothetical predicted protein [Pelobates cultripes]
MKTMITVLFFVLLSFQSGHSLECFQCDYGTCLIKYKAVCGLMQSCITYTSTIVGVSLKKRGCATPVECATEVSKTFLGANVKTTAHCCFTDFCNSAVVPRLSAVTGIAVLVVLWLVG